MKADNVHIIIPYYRGEEFIHACIRSIQQSEVAYTIWIIDNDPDGLQLKTEEDDVTVVRTAPGIGYGRAANVGITKAKEAGGTNFLLTNQDVIFENGAIDALFSDLEPDSLDVHVPLIKDYDSDELNSYFSRTVIPNGVPLDRHDTRSSIHINYAYGACLAFNLKLVEEVGLFDPVFRMYGEDDDLFKRVRVAGGSTRLQPNAAIKHYHNDEVATGSAKCHIMKQKLRSLGILTARYAEYSTSELLLTTASRMKYCFKIGKPSLAIQLARASVGGYTTGRNLSTELRDRIDAALKKDLTRRTPTDQ